MTNSSDTLWRYMKLSTFLLLLDGKAWFPSVKSLRDNDPLEAALGNEFHERLWERVDREEGGPQAVEWISRHRNWPEGWPEFDVGSIYARVYGQYAADNIAELRTAWCWFKSDLESAAMWSVYGHQGVAVRSDRSRLKESLPVEKTFRICDMIYVDRRKAVNENINRILQEQPDLILHPYFLKAIEYKHEQEVRVVAHCPEKSRGLMITDIKPEVLIREVCISPLLPSAEAESIKRFVEQRLGNPSMPVKRSSLTSGSASSLFAESLKETKYGNTDENIDLNLLPQYFRTL